MEKITRRKFLEYSSRGTVALTATINLLAQSEKALAAKPQVDQVQLGKTGIKTSRLALGTGTSGWKFQSAQTRLGHKGFLDLVQAAYEHGVTFFDLADTYGSHTYMREALKYIPREKIIIQSKIWTIPNDWMTLQDVQGNLDRFRQEIGTDYIDSVLLHAMVTQDWPTEMQQMREDLAKAKQKKIIRAHGITCHNFGALITAAMDDWVDVLQARINHDGKYLDHTPENVMSVLKEAHDNGKGIVGMKIFGAGKLATEAEREASLQFVLASPHVDAMSIGFRSIEQLNDTVVRINRILKG